MNYYKSGGRNQRGEKESRKWSLRRWNRGDYRRGLNLWLRIRLGISSWGRY